MKRFVYVILFASITHMAKGQLSEGGNPISIDLPQLKSGSEIKDYTLRRINIDRLKSDDEKNGVENRYAIFRNKTIDIKQKGSKTSLEDGSLWRLTIKIRNGYSIGLQFSEFVLPEGAKLFIYNKDYSLIYGAFTHKNNKNHKKLSVADFPGNEVIIEYYEPNAAAFDGALVIGKIGIAYKNINEPMSLKDAAIDNSDIDINCPEGDYVQLEKHAVAKMSYEKDGFSYLCTGALINNVNNDGTPFFLTANHCISDDISAGSLITRFNYEKKDCGSVFLETSSTLSGASVVATYEATDFTLLLLDEVPPANYQPYYAGWNAKDDSTIKSGTGIHHPQGSQKKVALEYNNFYSYPYQISWDNDLITPVNTHWEVSFDKGFTVGGSSGSPLLDNNNRIVGQLHGGSTNDYYGKLSQSWDGGRGVSQQLKAHLDPDNTGVLVHSGYAPADNIIDARLYSSIQNICANEPIKLSDGSLFSSPVSWNWSISPSTFVFVDGTDETSQHPVVNFSGEGSYNITLEVNDGAFSDTQTRSEYIKVGDNLDVEIRAFIKTDMCYADFDSIILYSYGVDSLKWEIASGMDYILIDSARSNKDSLIIKTGNYVIDSTQIIQVRLIGYHGNCSDTAYKNIHLIYPFNDSIRNAYPLNLGSNGPFVNSCAGIEENEPSPAAGDCNSQNTWCSCPSATTLAENSVWFTISGPASGIVAINAPGFDNQIALYDANSYSDIMSGDPSNYTILAANDDYFGEDENFSALIEGVHVTPGKTYWLQVDGSACGLVEGIFNLIVYDFDLGGPSSVSNTDELPGNQRIYPNPAKDYFVYKAPENSENVNIKLFASDGKLMKEYSIINSIADNDYKLELPKIETGVYTITITGKSYTQNQMLLVE